MGKLQNLHVPTLKPFNKVLPTNLSYQRYNQTMILSIFILQKKFDGEATTFKMLPWKYVTKKIGDYAWPSKFDYKIELILKRYCKLSFL